MFARAVLQSSTTRSLQRCLDPLLATRIGNTDIENHSSTSWPLPQNSHLPLPEICSIAPKYQALPRLSGIALTVKHCPDYQALPRISGIAQNFKHCPKYQAFPDCRALPRLSGIAPYFKHCPEVSGPGGVAWCVCVVFIWGSSLALFFRGGPALFIRCGPAAADSTDCR